MVRKKSELDLDYKPSKWKPGEAVAVLLSWSGKTYKIGGYEIFDESKEHSLASGCQPIELKQKPFVGELAIVLKGQIGRPVIYKESQVLKLKDVPKHELKTFDEVFGYAIRN